MSMSSNVGLAGIGVVLLWSALILTGLYGWVHNIIMLTTANFHPVGAEVVLRVVGIFLGPLGAILGLFVGHF